MSKKSTRGKIKDRTDYSELLHDIKSAESEVVSKEDSAANAEKNHNPENRKALLRMLSSEQVLYFHQFPQNIIHEKHCKLLKNTKADNLKPLSEYKFGPKQCPNCALRAYLRNGAEDHKKYKEYENLFGAMNADIKLIRKIFMEYNFKTRLTDASTVRIQNGVECWKLKLLNSASGTVSLSHNDYKLNYDGTRKKYATYHIQNKNCVRTDIRRAIGTIMNYKPHRALSAYSNREQQILKIIKDNPRETQSNIADTLGISLSSVFRIFHKLKENGTLHRIGGNRYGYWKLTL